MTKEKIKGHIIIFIVNVIFAVNIPVSKSLMPAHVSPEALTMLRMLFACICFWITSLFIKREKVSLKDLGLLFICGMCGVAFNQGAFIQGLNTTSPVDASIIVTATPIFVMILAAVILKEPITKMKVGGVLLGAAGAISLVLSANHTGNQVSSISGNLMVAFSGLIYSVYLVIAKPLTLKYSAVTIMKWMFLSAVIVLLPFLYDDVLNASAFQGKPDVKVYLTILFVLFGATYITYLMIPMALKRIRPTTVSMYNYLQPIVASFIAVAIGQDSFSFVKFVSAAMVFTGVYLVTQSKSKADLDRETEAANVPSGK